MPMDGGVPLRDRLATRAERIRDLSPAMRVIGEEIVKRTTEAFRKQQSPAGAAWPELADSTVRARVAKLPGASKRGKSGALTRGAQKKRAGATLAAGFGGARVAGITPLIDTGRLRSASQRYKLIGKDTLSWSTLRYGGAHMSGSVKRPGRPPKRNFSVFEPGPDGRWAFVPSMRAFAMRTLAQHVRSKLGGA